MLSDIENYDRGSLTIKAGKNCFFGIITAYKTTYFEFGEGNSTRGIDAEGDNMTIDIKALSTTASNPLQLNGTNFGTYYDSFAEAVKMNGDNQTLKISGDYITVNAAIYGGHYYSDGSTKYHTNPTIEFNVNKELNMRCTRDNTPCVLAPTPSSKIYFKGNGKVNCTTSYSYAINCDYMVSVDKTITSFEYATPSLYGLQTDPQRCHGFVQGKHWIF